MNALEVVQRYLAAWSVGDPAKLLPMFAEEGTHEDPTSGGPVGGEALARHVGGLRALFPDLSFAIVGTPRVSDAGGAVEWIMRGASALPVMSGAPTERAVELRGADFITLEDGRVRTAVRYFDQRTLFDQLGLQTSVQPPFPLESVEYGSCSHMSVGPSKKPGALSLTWIVPRSVEERQRLRDRMEKILLDMPETAGFLSMMLAGCGDKLFTLAAWSDPESPQKMAPQGAHRRAMEDFWKGDLGAASMTSLWVPLRINGPHIRCTACDQMVDYDESSPACGCGSRLPDPPHYW